MIFKGLLIYHAKLTWQEIQQRNQLGDPQTHESLNERVVL